MFGYELTFGFLGFVVWPIGLFIPLACAWYCVHDYRNLKHEQSLSNSKGKLEWYTDHPGHMYDDPIWAWGLIPWVGLFTLPYHIYLLYAMLKFYKRTDDLWYAIYFMPVAMLGFLWIM